MRLTRSAAARLRDGLQALAGQDWWHSTSYLSDAFKVGAITHVGEKAAAQHRLVSNESLSDARRQNGIGVDGSSRVSREIYRVRLRAHVKVLDPVLVESGGIEWDICAVGGPPKAGEVRAYVNRREAPGTLSLWLGTNCVESADAHEGQIQASFEKNRAGILEAVVL
ncbi:hypothetical protein [Nocardioides campestrisoli]|uniref:hypothetical protein n=1 Tax=Nocardioides campestrisoli TaxID=2736757 RepID=UPI00163DD0EC|nr:hypothetical protein [Nocardioides campestrisoli]